MSIHYNIITAKDKILPYQVVVLSKNYFPMVAPQDQKLNLND
jgi:hypothetical protein